MRIIRWGFTAIGGYSNKKCDSRYSYLDLSRFFAFSPLLESELAGFGESISRFVHRLCLLVLYRNALEYYCVSTTTETRYSGRPETELVYLSAYGKSCFILIGTGYCFTVHKNVKSIV